MPLTGKIIQAGCHNLNINPNNINMAVAVINNIPETESKKFVEWSGFFIPISLSKLSYIISP